MKVATLAQRLETAHRLDNLSAMAVSVEGEDPAYGELFVGLDRPYSWRVELEAHRSEALIARLWAREPVRLRMGHAVDRLDVSGTALIVDSEINGPGVIKATLLGNGPLAQHAQADPA